MFKRFWWVFLAMAGVGVIGGLMAAAVVAYVTPRGYESEATIEVRGLRKSLLGDETEVFSGAPDQMTQQVFGKEFEEIRNNDSLGKVVENLELTNRWGVDKETAIRILKRIVIAQNIRDTDLISIRVRHTNKEDARDIAAEVTRGYVAYRKDLENRVFENELLEMKRPFKVQENKVEEKRQSLAEVERTMKKNIQVEDGETLLHIPESNEYSDAKRELETEEQLLQTMKLKRLSESLGCVLTAESVTVHEEPQIAKFPVSPNVRLVLALGSVGGFLLSQLLALPVILLLNRLMPAKVLP